ncbi:hypothetical protein J2S77_002228 [Alkalibacillus salilacus]|uniref:Uncharacterized protein n=1 Tax=Alkalibacillus salilacus TaxID=284582 RepID=A0ABT9VGY6_9BACI|nr:hypothetical protein [Alkalibacillus salilacus]
MMDRIPSSLWHLPSQSHPIPSRFYIYHRDLLFIMQVASIYHRVDLVFHRPNKILSQVHNYV